MKSDYRLFYSLFLLDDDSWVLVDIAYSEISARSTNWPTWVWL